MNFRSLILLLAALVMTGCATVNRGEDDHFRIDTVPQGATAITSIETAKSRRDRRRDKTKSAVYKSCTPTPCAIKLPRTSEFIVRLEYDDYEPVEMFITNSSRRGSFTANTAATVVTTAGTTAATAATLAVGAAAFAGATTGATLGLGVAGLGSFTAGLVSTETITSLSISAFNTGFSTGSSVAPSTGTILSSAIPPALIATGGMILIDAGTGANKNFFPNPVVLELTPEGNPVKTDPLVPLHRERVTLQKKYDRSCPQKGEQVKKAKRKACQSIKRDLNQTKSNIKNLITPKKPKS